ncbi:uncharacterized protein LOC134259522 [Saccostrea cucullata]|uniref:uncharacterized protein LOC134259522 n=1 Tax=Saccostrea cuccullata TaxID=36930 RepID=UPI002ED0B9C4
MDIKGFRVHGVPSGTNPRDIYDYFEKSENGGTEIEDIYYPLQNNDAVVVFTNDGYQHAFDKNHSIGGNKLVLSKLPIQLFANVSVFLEQAITQLLDENPPLMKSLEKDSDVEVVFDPKFMTYRIVGNPFQIEWTKNFIMDAWQKDQENKKKMTNGSTNGATEGKSKTEGRRSSPMVNSEESESSEDDISYSPRMTYESKQNRTDMDRRHSPTPRDLSTVSKKTKKSNDHDRETFRSNISSSEMYPQTSNVKFNSQVLGKMDSPLRMSDCRVSSSDPRSASKSTSESRKPDITDKIADKTKPKAKLQNLTDNEKHGIPFNASSLLQSRPTPSQSLFAPSVNKKTPQVFKNYDSDSDSDDDIKGRRRVPEEFSVRGEERRYRPPPPPIPPPPSRNLHTAFPPPNRNFQMGMSLCQSDFPELALEHETPIGGVIVKLIMGDILTQKSDAIVSPASTDLSTLYGISAVIARNADRKMKQECADYVAKNGNLLFGDVIHTCAGGNLDPKVTYILHAAVPSWREDSPEQSCHLLTCTYLNCFQYADKIWLSSLSMPIIGAGYFAAPLDVCVQSFHDAILLFTHGTNPSKHLKEVFLVSNDQDSACSSVVVFRSLMDLDEDQAYRAAVERYCKRSQQYDFSARDFVLDRSSPSQGLDLEKDCSGKNDEAKEEKGVNEGKTQQEKESEVSEKRECFGAFSIENEKVMHTGICQSERAKDNKEESSDKWQINDSDDETKDEDEENWRKSNDDNAQTKHSESDLHNVSLKENDDASFLDDTASSSVIEKLLTTCGSDKNSDDKKGDKNASDEDDL